jgi:hypothetical protein
VAGWWYVRNVQLYGDWSGWNAFIAVLGQRAHPASLAQLWGERWGFMLAYWGLFGGVNVPMATWIYHLLNGVAVLGVAGFGVYLARQIRQWPAAIRGAASPLDAALALAARHFPLLLCLLWSAAIVLGLIRWATTTWSSQGRLVFSAISALTTLLVVGLAGWLPRRPAGALLVALSAFLFAVAAHAPFAVIRPAYRPDSAAAGDIRLANIVFGDRLRLAGYSLEPAAVRPGDTVRVTLVWEVLARMERDWSVFVHLNDPVLAAPVSQRDMYPDQGLRPTRLLRPGEILADDYVLAIPPTTIAPTRLGLTVGLYDYTSGERLPASSGGDAAVLAELLVEPRPGELPNPAGVNLENELELVGFQVEPRRVAPGQTVELVLYWRPFTALEADYTFFAQVLDEDTTRWASQDLAPPEGTSSWPAGEVRSLPLSLVVAAGAPDGVYPLIVGAYSRPAGGGFDRLQLVTPEGRLADDFVLLTRIRVAR